MELSEIDYELPKQAVAQSAVEPRDASRMLVCNPDGSFLDSHVRNLCEFIGIGDLLIGNRTRVMTARLSVTRKTGAACELLFLRPCDSAQSDGWWEALARPSRRIKSGEILAVGGPGSSAARDQVAVEVGEVIGDGRRFARGVGMGTNEILCQFGQLPLPPYFCGKLDTPDRYQTVFAAEAGSIAAPAAGLHFTDRLVREFANSGIGFATVNLDIGVDTFRPVTEANPLEHPMHEEAYSVDERTVEAIGITKASGCAVIAVGTTSARAVEAAAVRDDEGKPTGEIRAGSSQTSLFITPGHKFLIDGLLTNFHAPRSTLLLLLAAIYPPWRKAYTHALDRGYRFLSFGDAMFIRPGRSIAKESEGAV